MSSRLVAGPPLEVPGSPVGRVSTELIDAARGDRRIPLEVWYPAAAGGAGELSEYEILPGVGFTASAMQDVAVAPGAHPMVVWSHGRTGTRQSYVLLCEALASRGFVVAAPEHAGDALGDWVVGAAVDDETNETNRIGDAHFVLDTVLEARGALAPFAATVDATRIAAAGHSYGGFTALSVGSGATRHASVRAVAGLQSFTRSMPKQVFVEMSVPTLLAVGEQDATTPPETDADRAWAKLGVEPAWRVDVAAAGHQACSDVGLYIELAPHVEGVPDLVRAFVESMATDITGTAGDPWRPTVALHARMLGAFLEGALGIDPVGAREHFTAIAETPGVRVDARGDF